MPLRIDILTLFCEMFDGFLEASIVGRAVRSGLVEVHRTNIRDFAADSYGKVDDKPFGGGPGMVIKLQPIVDCIEAVIKQADGEGRSPRVIITTCRGKTLDQAMIDDWLGHVVPLAIDLAFANVDGVAQHGRE